MDWLLKVSHRLTTFQDALEKLVHQQTDHDSQSLPSHDDYGASSYKMLSFFAREFQRFNDSQANSLQERSETTQSSKDDPPPPKRRRLSGEFTVQQEATAQVYKLPEEDQLDLLLRAYYAHVHPWIPMLHEARLRRRLDIDDESQSLSVVIRAMVLVAAKYIQDEDVAAILTVPEHNEQQARDEIVATAMRQLSVENLQALIMVAFNDVSLSNLARASPLTDTDWKWPSFTCLAYRGSVKS